MREFILSLMYMTWPVLALLAALFAGISSIPEKRALFKEHSAAFAEAFEIINLKEDEALI